MIAEKIKESIYLSAFSGELITPHLNIQSSREELQKDGIHVVKPEFPPFSIPDHWSWVRFGDLVDFSLGKTPKRAHQDYWTSGTVPWVSISDMAPGARITKTKEKVSNIAIDEVFKGKLSPKGTLLMSFKLTIGRCSFLSMDAVHNEAIISIFPRVKNGRNFNQYLSYLLPVVAPSGKSKSAIKGETLNKKSLSDLLIPVPPEKERDEIVELLNTVLPLIDELAELERERESI